MPDNDALTGLDWDHAAKVSTFRAAAPDLAPADQLALLEAAAETLDRHYAHLPQKRATWHTDPVAALRDWRTNLAQAATPMPALAFHARLSALFAGLHDLHTLYILPPYFASSVAFLPFTAARIGPHGADIVVSHVLPRMPCARLRPGVALVTWNGRPIADELADLAASSGGANPAAAAARALQMLTQRPLLRTPPPEADQVVLGLRAAGEPVWQLTLDWRVSSHRPDPQPQPTEPPTEPPGALDGEGDLLHRHRRHHQGPQAGRVHGAAVSAAHPWRRERDTGQPDIQAWEGELAGRRFGVLRLQSFKVPDEDGFIATLQALLADLPPDGLILDVRDNPGGLVAAAERLLQCFSDAPIRPVGVAFRATTANLALCQANTPTPGHDVKLDLSAFTAPLAAALAAGQTWSAALPMTLLENFGPGRRAYPGPVVLLTSGCCYSACDIFIAGFRDHRLGPILGVDDNIGAGGANMWRYSQIALLLTGTATLLPGDADLHVATRRVFRADASATPLEELGIVPDHIHHPTRRDVLDHDIDLFTQAARLIARA